MTFNDLLEAFILLYPPINVVVYLICSHETSLNRIRERGRSFEIGVSAEYLGYIDQQYNKWVRNLPSETQI